MKIYSLFLLLFLSSTSLIFSQVGGFGSFEFVNIPENARLAAIGGQNVSSKENNPNDFTFNPALLTSDSKNNFSFNFTPFYADINKTSMVYSIHDSTKGSWVAKVEYLSYGEITERNTLGQATGEFKSADYAITIGHSHQINNFIMGANAKIAGSHIGSYSAHAILFDLGGLFVHPKKDFTIALAMKNFGIPFNNFGDSKQTSAPFDIQAGFSYKFDHLPFKFSTTIHNLHRYDAQYLNPQFHTTFTNDGTQVPEEKNTANKVFRHFTFGGELLFSKNFHLRIGYNHLRRLEMKVDHRSMAGFSFGAMIKIKGYEISYGRNIYHTAGGVNSFTFGTDLSRFSKKKNSFSKKEIEQPVMK